MKIGYRIKDLRIQQRITLKDLAKKTGLTTSFLSQLERDLASPSVSSLEKIAEALNTKVGHFFEREEGKELIFVKKGINKKIIDKEKNISSVTLASGFLKDAATGIYFWSRCRVDKGSDLFPRRKILDGA